MSIINAIFIPYLILYIQINKTPTIKVIVNMLALGYKNVSMKPKWIPIKLNFKFKKININRNVINATTLFFRYPPY